MKIQLQKTMKKMKYMFIIAGTMMVMSCASQDRKSVSETGLIRFEDKQKQATEKSSEMSNPRKEPGDPATLPDFRQASQRAMRGVVHIMAKSQPAQTGTPEGFQQLPEPFRDFFGDEFFFRRPRPSPRTASGSGVIISDDGYIVTNNHVVANADKIEVTLHDNRSFQARIVGTDPDTDLALIKVDEQALDFVEFGNSDEVRVGDWVLAVGNPFNLSSTVTAGIVSAKARNINILRENYAIESFIQTDAAVNPGNSGGALTNLEGKLIGVNTAIASPTGAYAGYAFAVPVNIVKKVSNDLLNYGVVQRGYLGITIRDMNSELAEELGVDITRGVYIDSIIPESAADDADLKEEDIIVGLDDEKITSAPEVQEFIGRRRPGDTVMVTVNRKGKEREFEVILENRRGTTRMVKKQEQEITDVLGIRIADLSSREKASLKVEGGVKVVEIGQGVVREQTRVKPGFIILEMNRKKVKNTDQFIRMLENASGGVMVGGIYPGYPGMRFYAFGLE